MSVQDSMTSAGPDTVWVEQVAWFDRVPRSVAMALVFAVFVGLWDAVTRFGFVSPIILPTPAETFADLIFVGRNLLSGEYMLAALWVTLREVAYGFALAMFIGFSLGILVGETAFGERAIMPYLVAIDTMPKVAFAPSSSPGSASTSSPRSRSQLSLRHSPSSSDCGRAPFSRCERPNAVQDHGRIAPADVDQDEAADRSSADLHRAQDCGRGRHGRSHHW